MSEKKKRSGKKIKMSAGMWITMLIGGVCGIFMSVIGSIAFGDFGFGILMLEFAIFAISYFVELIIHELGHLIAGLMTGYGFGSFRIGSLMIVKENGKIKFKKHSVAGTGGQCLMTPPPLNDGDYPVILYNLGGVIINMISAAICAALAIVFIDHSIVFCIFAMTAISAFLVAVTNGIPLKLGVINNDGSNARELYKNREAKVAFHNQFKMIELITAGVRLRDMDDSLFPLPSEEGMQNSISASAAVFHENRLMDQGKYDKALLLIDKLISEKNALIGLHKSLLVADKITILLLRQQKLEIVKEYYTSSEYVTFKKQMPTSISVLRTDYAYLLLYDKNEEAAEKLLSKFEICAKTHPYAPDVESEREMIAQIQAVYRTIKEEKITE